jgi:hypothetical protein
MTSSKLYKLMLSKGLIANYSDQNGYYRNGHEIGCMTRLLNDLRELGIIDIILDDFDVYLENEEDNMFIHNGLSVKINGQTLYLDDELYFVSRLWPNHDRTVSFEHLIDCLHELFTDKNYYAKKYTKKTSLT